MLAALSATGGVAGPLQALGAHAGALSLLRHLPSFSQSRGASSNGRHSSVYITDVDNNPTSHMPLLLGLVNYFERHMPYVGYFCPIGGSAHPDSGSHPLDRHLRLVHDAFELCSDVKTMFGVAEDEAVKLLAMGKRAELIDRIYASYAAYKDMHDVVLVQGTSIGTGKLDAEIAGVLNAPAIIACQAKDLPIGEIVQKATLKKVMMIEQKVPILGVAVNKVPARDLAISKSQLQQRLSDAGLHFLGAVPEDKLLRAVRLDEVQIAMEADFKFGSRVQLDQEYSAVYVASQGLEQLLELMANDGDTRPLVVTSRDRLDIVMGLLASQVSVAGPNVACILLTHAGPRVAGVSEKGYTETVLTRTFDGLSKGYKGSLVPVLSTEMSLFDAVRKLDHLQGSVLPTSSRKISHCKALFDRYIDANSVVIGLEKEEASVLKSKRITPKMFAHSIKQRCIKNPQRIVLPEGMEPRVIKAASEVTAKGYAKITLLGDPQQVTAEAKKLGADISGCSIVDPKNFAGVSRYVEALLEARKGKNLTRDAALDAVTGDVNMFGVMMVAMGDAGGMVSGSIHTTAATIRPAMQVLKTPNLVSSVFFMCLPDKVMVYGDCAVNVSPTSKDLASIAACSADTAAAFGIEPRVAMLSYSTMGSGAGPDVQKVTDAVQLVKEARPDLMVEGPLQYDAAIDPTVAAVKIKTQSEVAGRATVFIFPDLNTGNNTYKAVQQATGAIAMGPVMQGLRKPVNDLSRGCTVEDIVNTICVTGIQASASKPHTAAAA